MKNIHLIGSDYVGEVIQKKITGYFESYFKKVMTYMKFDSK